MRPSPDDAVTIVVTQHLGNWTSATVTPVLPGISDACNTCGTPQIGVQQGGSAMRIRMRFSLFMAVAARPPLAPEQDPRWYAQQVTALESELSTIDSHEDELRQFRATSAGLPTGLVLNAPVEGIT